LDQAKAAKSLLMNTMNVLEATLASEIFDELVATNKQVPNQENFPPDFEDLEE
jgi:hypothetical protein